MRLSIRILLAFVALCALSTASPVYAVPATIDFEAPSLGAAARQIINPYIDAATGVQFTAEPGSFGDEVVGLVKNNGTSACVDPADDNQKLGTGRASVGPDGSIGFAGFAIRATFPTALAPPVSVGVEFQTLAGQTIRLRLFNSANVEVGSATDTAGPAAGTCGFPGDPRGKKTITATASETVAYAIMDMDTSTGGYVFVLDNFTFDSGPATGLSIGSRRRCDPSRWGRSASWFIPPSARSWPAIRAMTAFPACKAPISTTQTR